MTRRLLWFALSLLPVGVHAQVPLEKVLLPIVLSGVVIPGAYGSMWTTSLWITNTADRPVLIEPYDYGCTLTTCVQPPTPAGVTFRPGNSALLPVPGLFMFVERAAADEVAFSLRAQDLSRQAETWGTEIPVVREDDWRSRVTVLDIPTHAEFRTLVRIYEFGGATAVPVRVRVHGIAPKPHPLSSTPDPLLGERVVSVLPITAYHPRTPPEQPVSTVLYPGFTQLDLSFADTAGHDLIRVDIESLDNTKRIWAFAAVTNNVTQHLTVKTPNK